MRRRLVVADVRAFPGHIACDVASNAEIVVPLVADGVVIGVLDLDSPRTDRFGAGDAALLERLASAYVAASDAPVAAWDSRSAATRSCSPRSRCASVTTDTRSSTFRRGRISGTVTRSSSICRRPRPKLASWVERHAQHFPAALVRKRTIVWETQGDAARAPRIETPPHGVLERSIVFVRTERYGAPPDERIRPLRDDADWDAAAALNAAEEEDSSLAMQSFARWRFGVVRDDASCGRMRMWGLWHEGELAAYAGVYASDALARFATPVTRERDRGRGFFRRLCETAVDATLDDRPDATIVICATAGRTARGDLPPARIRRHGRAYTASSPSQGALY